MDPARSLMLIYNADGTLRGKLRYAYRKLTSSAQQGPACAACDITHGGLSLSETPGWSSVKRSIEQEGWKVDQKHRDEVPADVREWIKARGIRYPVVLSQQEDKEAEVMVTPSELADCQGDPGRFYDILVTKGLVSGPEKGKPNSSL